MKNLFLAFILLTATIANAQPAQKQMKSRTAEEQASKEWRNDQLQFSNTEEMAKVLEIDQATADQAWKIYTEYKESSKALMATMRTERKEMQSRGEKMTEADYEKGYRTKLGVQRKRIDLEESYYNRFLEIMPASKIQKLLKSNKNRNGKHEHQNKRTEREY